MAVNRTKAPEPDWAEIRRAFETGGETIPALCARFGVTPGMLRRRRAREGWPVRRKRRPAQAAKAGDTSPRALAARLTACIAAQIARLEERMAETDGPPDGKDIWALGELARARQGREGRGRSVREDAGDADGRGR